MIEPGSEIEVRLAEIDRKLGEIQAELAPLGDRLAERGAGDGAGAEPAGEGTVEELLVSLRGLHAELARFLERHAAAPAPPGVTVTAGPFATIADVQAFEERLRSLPDVEDAVVRNYEGVDRAIFDLRLATATS